MQLVETTTRLASRSQDDLDLTATLVTTTLTDYQDLKASIVATEASPPMLIYPRNGGLLAAGAVAVLAYFVGSGLESLQNALEPDLQRVTLQQLQGNRPNSITIEDDQACKSVPKCKSCSGSALGVCGSGSQKGCPCQPENKCPSADKRFKCSVSSCKGDEYNRCTEGELAGCSCIGPIGNPAIVDYYETDWINVQQTVLESFSAETDSCWQNNVQNLPKGFFMSTGSQTPNDLLYRLREKICSNECKIPDQLPSNGDKITKVWPSIGANGACEISIALQNNIEAYIYRNTAASGIEQQECWDFTEDLINNCIKGQGNKGWTNGPDDNQFYELGFRPLNGAGSNHDKFSGNDFLKSSFDVTCATSQEHSKVLGDQSKVKSKAQDVCKSLANQKLIMNYENNQLPTNFPRDFKKATSNGDSLIFSLVWSKQACEDQNNEHNLDFTSYSQDQCVKNFIDEGGATCTNGGRLSKDCAIWSVSAY
ncbi:hypothetical protein F5B20DRAFT_587438 [Whalleya microplaca]|nr:hypothetical protein F5B20DRAFT_587438 [Whalleya microplaca]